MKVKCLACNGTGWSKKLKVVLWVFTSKLQCESCKGKGFIKLKI